jgi:hypothetical protein
MSEEFEKYRDKMTFSESCSQDYKDGCMDGVELAWWHQQEKLDAQAEELAALRGYAKATYKDNAPIAFKYGLYDSNYDPTYILTGEKKLGVSYVMAVKE